MHGDLQLVLKLGMNRIGLVFGRSHGVAKKKKQCDDEFLTPELMLASAHFCGSVKGTLQHALSSAKLTCVTFTLRR